jgi:hypothetical protein
VIRESAYCRALQTSLHGAALPYGYAITVWSMGTALIGEHGSPTWGEILLFAVGATSAFGALMVLTGENGGEAKKQLSRSPHPGRAGLLHLVAIGAAITGAVLTAQIPGSAAWLLTTLVATLLYLGISSVEVATVERGDGASESGE